MAQQQRRARLSATRSRVAWPVAVVLALGVVLRIVAVAHGGGGWVVVASVVGGVALLLGLIALAVWRATTAARRGAAGTGLPYVISVVVPARDLTALGAWRGRFGRRTTGVGMIAATDGHRLELLPVQLISLGRGPQRCGVDLDQVRGAAASSVLVGARSFPAVALELPTSTLTLGCRDWAKADVEHSPLARFVDVPSAAP